MVGGSLDTVLIMIFGVNGIDTEPIPRHREVAELLAKKILKIAKNNPGEEQ